MTGSHQALQSSRGWPSRLGSAAWFLAAVSVLVVLGAVVTGAVYGLRSGDFRTFLSHQLLTPFITVGFAALGALVASRRPRNPIGWIFLVEGFLFALSGLAAATSVYGVPLARWLNIWVWVPSVFLPTIFVFLYFPGGRLPSPRWRPLAWAGGLGLLASVLVLALHPGPLQTWGTSANPYGLLGAVPLLDLLEMATWPLLALGFAGSLAALLVRFRRSRGVERQQMKWLLYAALLMVLGFLASSAIWFVWPVQELAMEFSIVLTNVSILGIALAAAVAILRHNLYDIDVIINRTLVYGGLTTVVALLYVLSVGATGLAIQQGSQWVGLLLTVALAVAIYNPLRRRVQAGVNRLLPERVESQPGTESSAAVDLQGAGTAPAPATAGDEHLSEESQQSHLTILLPVGIFLLLALSYLWLHVTTPFDVARLRPGQQSITARGLIVTPVKEKAGGLQAGDLVVAVAGRSLASWADALLTGDFARPQWQVGESVSYTVLREGRQTEVAVTLENYPLATIAGRNWGTIVFALVYILVAAFVYLRRPADQAARVLLLAAAALFAATTWSLGAQVSDFVDGVGFWLFQLTTFFAYTVFWTASFHFALVFPRPLRLFARRTWVTPLFYGFPYLLWGAYILRLRGNAANTLEWISGWSLAADTHAAVFLFLAMVTSIQQYRTNRTGETRQKIRWVVLATLLAGGVGLFLYLLPPLFGGSAIHPNYIGLIVLLFPLSIAIAILRHRLFDIDVLLNRALVYGALTLAIVGLYVLVVGTLGAIFQTQGDLFVALVATGLAAILFQPLRDRLQRGANRLIYGERDEPFEVVARLGRRLEATLSPDATLSAIVSTVAEALKLPYVAISLPDEEGMETVVSYGKPSAEPASYALLHQGEAIGRLLAAPRSSDETFSEAEERLLRSVARQAGSAVRAARLTADLQRSRQQLVTAREEERRRLRRDLHDGLGPALAALHLQAGMARRLTQKDPQEAAALLAELQEEIGEAIEDVRRVVYALRPPVLDQLGLAAAVRAQAAQCSRDGLQVEVQAPESLPPLPAAVEVAAYRIAQEALTNVVHHAQAAHCQVHLQMDDGLRLEITDDGRGLPQERQAGVGLLSMRERAEELGGTCRIGAAPAGGTRVAAHLPLPKEAEGGIET